MSTEYGSPPTRILNHLPFLTLLTGALPQQRKALLSTASLDQVDCICEITLNVLTGNLTVDKSDLEKLKKHKKRLRQLTQKSVSRKNKRGILKRISRHVVHHMIAPVLNLMNVML